ncbi:MAG: tetratricopeptide repeat protein [Fimbriimonadales bacterium]
MSKLPLDLPSDSESIKCGPLRLSKRGVWRAGVLIAVYVAIILHIVHWKIAGRTVTPVEPSEAMQTLELGYVNAGIILFVILILSTLIFGRFFCGWGCHVVALQDLCGWVLKKLGMKPKAFRSRLLVYVPLFAAFYMFILPTILRLAEGAGLPKFTSHLMTENFWATFPTPGITILTFVVCGFLIVWLVGNKGFCTYGCPYGAFFYYADKAAPGKIRVTDDCEQCGHCTATCTSNVRVHEEVARFGMVVDAGCMKCMDCVSVCPKNALYYGFGRTALTVKASSPPKSARKYDFTWPEEIAMAVVFLASMYAWRDLYNAVPFLLALGLSAITAFLSVAVARLFYAPNVRWQRFQLRRDSSLTPSGFGTLLLGALLAVFLTHSAIWNYNYHEGNRLDAAAIALAGTDPEAASKSAERAAERYLWCSDNGFFEVSTVEAGIGSAFAFNGKLQEGEQRLQRAVELGPELTNAWVQLGRTQAMLGKQDAAIQTLTDAFERDNKNAEAAHELGLTLMASDKPADALKYLEAALKVTPGNPQFLTDYGMALAQTGKNVDAVRQLELALEKGASVAARMNLGLVHAESGNVEEARKAFQQVIVGDPQMLQAQVALSRLEFQAKDYDAAVAAAESALVAMPFNSDALTIWAEALKLGGKLEAEIAKLIRSKPEDEASWYRAAWLYRHKGDDTTARSLFNRLLIRNPNLPRPN